MAQSSPSAGGMSAAQEYQYMKTVSDSLLSSLSTTQALFIVWMRAISEDVVGEDLRVSFAEMLPPVHLFCCDIWDMPSIWIEMRSFLDSRSAMLSQHFSRRVTMTIAHVCMKKEKTGRPP